MWPWSKKDDYSISYIPQSLPPAPAKAAGGFIPSQFSVTANTNVTDYATAFTKVIQQMNASSVVGSSAPDVRFSGKEFAANSVKGARSFRIDALGRLTGVSFKKVWMPGENTSECLAGVPHKDGKFPECKCGFYGYYEGSNDFHDKGMVSAVVEGYGDAVIGTSGFRVTKARILALTINDHVPAALARLVRRNYSEIPMFESFARMLTEYPADFELDEKPIASPDEPDFWTRDAS